MNHEAEQAATGTSSARTAEEALDEVILESFPASDPPASWSGLTEPEAEAPAPVAGEEPA